MIQKREKQKFFTNKSWLMLYIIKDSTTITRAYLKWVVIFFHASIRNWFLPIFIRNSLLEILFFGKNKKHLGRPNGRFFQTNAKIVLGGK